MRFLVFAAALLSCLPLRAEQPLEVKRGDLKVVVRTRGTVVAKDVVRLKATIDGRVEDVFASTWTWMTDGDPLGHLSNKEMAALLDANKTTAKGLYEDRWKRVYEPTKIRCPSDCFVLRRFVSQNEWVKPKALLFEAALRLDLEGRIRPEDAHLIRDGMTLEFWAVDDPSKKLTAKITRYVLDLQGQKVDPGGSFTITLQPNRYLPPGTEWEGTIVPLTRKNVLIVPTDSLIRYADGIYLPVRVSTGVTTEALTEITSGVENKRKILVIDDKRLKSSVRYKQEVDYDAINRRVSEDYMKVKPAKTSIIQGLPEPDRQYAEDPYSE